MLYFCLETSRSFSLENLDVTGSDPGILGDETGAKAGGGLKVRAVWDIF